VVALLDAKQRVVGEGASLTSTEATASSDFTSKASWRKVLANVEKEKKGGGGSLREVVRCLPTGTPPAYAELVRQT
jgi:hypothetical protein